MAVFGNNSQAARPSIDPTTQQHFAARFAEIGQHSTSAGPRPNIPGSAHQGERVYRKIAGNNRRQACSQKENRPSVGAPNPYVKSNAYNAQAKCPVPPGNAAPQRPQGSKSAWPTASCSQPSSPSILPEATSASAVQSKHFVGKAKPAATTRYAQQNPAGQQQPKHPQTLASAVPVPGTTVCTIRQLFTQARTGSKTGSTIVFQPTHTADRLGECFLVHCCVEAFQSCGASVLPRLVLRCCTLAGEQVQKASKGAKQRKR